MAQQYYKIGDLADLLKITVRTIRYYEEEKLIEPERTNGGTRIYTNQHLARLKSIIHLTRNNFSLDVIRLIGKTRETCLTGNESSKKVSKIIEHSIENIENDINNLKHLKNELFAAKKQIEKCKGCKNSPSKTGCPSCPVEKNRNKIEILNLIWE